MKRLLTILMIACVLTCFSGCGTSVETALTGTDQDNGTEVTGESANVLPSASDEIEKTEKEKTVMEASLNRTTR